MKLNIKSLNYSTILTLCLVVVLTLLSELSNSLKTFLTNITGHHWVTKSAFSLIFFIVIYLLISKIINDEDVTKQLKYTVIAVILGGLIIFVFYLWHFV